MSHKVHKYAFSRILLINQILNPKQVTQISGCNFHQDPMIPNVGGCAIYGRLGILVSVALLGSVIIQMSSLGRATDVQHNYPVYLNCHLSHLASRTLPPSSISQTLSTDSTQPRNLVPFNAMSKETKVGQESPMFSSLCLSGGIQSFSRKESGIHESESLDFNLPEF